MPTTKTTTKRASSEGVFTEDERAAMREAAKERRAAKSGKANGEADLLAKIAEMPDGERELAQRLHALITATAPALEPKTWYGMPAYAQDGKLICFFQPATKFKARYFTLGFTDNANLDDGNMWPTSFALTKLTSADEAKIRALITQATADPTPCRGYVRTPTSPGAGPAPPMIRWDSSPCRWTDVYNGIRKPL
jgi:hypothetical protein